MDCMKTSQAWISAYHQTHGSESSLSLGLGLHIHRTPGLLPPPYTIPHSRTKLVALLRSPHLCHFLKPTISSLSEPKLNSVLLYRKRLKQTQAEPEETTKALQNRAHHTAAGLTSLSFMGCIMTTLTNLSVRVWDILPTVIWGKNKQKLSQDWMNHHKPAICRAASHRWNIS